jgi:hypothetical protein
MVYIVVSSPSATEENGGDRIPPGYRAEVFIMKNGYVFI